MEYLATFFTHFGAVKFKRNLIKQGIEAETLPVPRKFSSNCGIGVKFSTEGSLLSLLDTDIEKVFLLQDGIDRVVFENEQE